MGCVIAYAFDVRCSAITSTNAVSIVRTKLGSSAIISSGCGSSTWRRIGTVARARIVCKASTVTGPAWD